MSESSSPFLNSTCFERLLIFLETTGRFCQTTMCTKHRYWRVSKLVSKLGLSKDFLFPFVIQTTLSCQSKLFGDQFSIARNRSRLRNLILVIWMWIVHCRLYYENRLNPDISRFDKTSTWNLSYEIIMRMEINCRSGSRRDLCLAGKVVDIIRALLLQAGIFRRAQRMPGTFQACVRRNESKPEPWTRAYNQRDS